MGSGKILKRAIKKYGLEHFEKSILYIFHDELEMNLKEAELVNDEFCLREDTYNICPGGKGGFGYINNVIWDDQKRKEHCKKITPFGDPEFYNRYRDYHKGNWENGMSAIENYRNIHGGTFKGKKHSKQSIDKMSKARPHTSGEKNSQYGKMWITNGNENRKIDKDSNIPEGWVKGRKIKKPAKQVDNLQRVMYKDLVT